ncbi:hypothetical protein BT96DRAFT_918201 [Gymnopus androsaceus JB14]|uniref:Uncharacterized protein n=1 Tax=Gymnopus androsaceus JB14 TaxID=1447944 RepID=A0A6A4HTL2_9AGAR|nr:hypothetical protein BT96DRAFT_918201 [Gymnopus androsaceus JB14]
MNTPALPQTECGAQPVATPDLTQSDSSAGAQPAPTNPDPAIPLIRTRAPREHCPIWKIYKADHHDDANEASAEARLLAQKKQKAQTKTQNRKRKREAVEANIEYKQTFHGAPVKYAFLKNLWENSQPIRPGTYQVVSHSTRPSHLIANFGRNLALKQDPDPEINYEPYSVNDYPENEQSDEQARRIAFDRELGSFLGAGAATTSRQRPKTTLL